MRSVIELIRSIPGGVVCARVGEVRRDSGMLNRAHPYGQRTAQGTVSGYASSSAMAKSLPLVLAIILLAGCASPEGRNHSPSAKTIFREVRFEPYGPIRLGEPLDVSTPEGTPRTSTTLTLLGHFGDADSIIVHFDSSNRVVALDFLYQRAKKFSDAAREYETTLGSPVQNLSADSGTTKVRHLIWEDSRTRFELREVVPARGAPQVSSILSERRSHL